MWERIQALHFTPVLHSTYHNKAFIHLAQKKQENIFKKCLLS